MAKDLIIIRRDGILRAGVRLPEGTVITNATPGERRAWLHFKEVVEQDPDPEDGGKPTDPPEEKTASTTTESENPKGKPKGK